MASQHPIGTPFIELLTVESTNNYAMGMVHAGMAHHGIAVFTHDQTKGKGQRSRQWQSQKGQNIAISLILTPDGFALTDLFLISMTIATAARTFLASYTNGGVTIKWPNDIYWRDRKAGGILIENVLQGPQWRFAIAGIGLNINQTDFGELRHRAVSLRQIAGQSFSPIELARELCLHVERQWQLLNKDAKAIVLEYNQHLYRRQETVRFRKGNQAFDATVKEVLPSGRLVVQHGMEEQFEVGEVEWVGNIEQGTKPVPPKAGE